MPVFNGAHWMLRAIRSLLDQTYQDFELIIVDNASTDSSFEIACAQTKDPRVRVVRNESNIGLAGNFRKTLALARGEFFMWTSVDDVWRPGFVAAMVQELDQNPSGAVAMSAIGYIGKNDPVDSERFREGGEKYPVGGVERFRGQRDPSAMPPLKLALELASLRKYNLFVCGLFRRSVLQGLTSPFPDSVSPERIMLTELALSRSFRYVDEILYHRQLHEDEHERRYPDGTYARLVARGLVGDLHYAWTLFISLALSPAVPLHRKLLSPLIAGMSAVRRASVHLRSSRRGVRRQAKVSDVRAPYREARKAYQTRAGVKWNEDALGAISVKGPFPDHSQVRPLETTGVFRVEMSEDLIFIKALKWARAVPNGVPTAKLQWRDGDLTKISVHGEFPQHGDRPPFQEERLFRVYRTRNKVTLYAVEDTPRSPQEESD